MVELKLKLAVSETTEFEESESKVLAHQELGSKGWGWMERETKAVECKKAELKLWKFQLLKREREWIGNQFVLSFGALSCPEAPACTHGQDK